MPPAVFESAVPASERPQSNALDRAATEIGVVGISQDKYAKLRSDKVTII
jgi:hypothetical protein